VHCQSVTFEIDRRGLAHESIERALGPYATALAGDLRIDVWSLTVHMRCHGERAANVEGYCVSDTRLALVAKGVDRDGQAIEITASLGANEGSRANCSASAPCRRSRAPSTRCRRNR
jgi:hypothetical protein